MLSSYFSFSLILRASYSRNSMGNILAMSTNQMRSEYPIYADDSLMCAKDFGTCISPAMANLRWNCDINVANRICCHNRHYAEHSGYFLETQFPRDALDAGDNGISFYDSISGKELFHAPRNRSMIEFLDESKKHGWPSFRDSEVNWDNVRCLKNGETVSIDGTHLGHNLPDGKGNRYCINLVSVAGNKIPQDCQNKE